ncbi:MAG: type II toxin-antitoxin system VapC family toxin [Anaerolineales bacterium]|nr:type II toxin-antitoxin system VapC family toxin [Anaerolineales bacterium]
MIDTDILIDHFHGNSSAQNYIAESLLNGEQLAISVVTLTELLAGMRAGEEVRTESLISLFRLCDVTPDIARRAGAYLNQYRKSNRLELGDAYIAATAAIHGAEVVTRNVKHYPMADIAVTEPYQRGAGKGN